MIDGFTVEQSKKWSNRGASTVLAEMYYQNKVKYFFGLNMLRMYIIAIM